MPTNKILPGYLPPTTRSPSRVHGLSALLLAGFLWSAAAPAWAQNPPVLLLATNELTLNEDTSADLDFELTDGDGSSTGMTRRVLSDNWTLIPTNYVTFPDNIGTNRTMNIQPATNEFGTATVTLLMDDGEGIATGEVLVTVLSMPEPPTIALATNAVTFDEDTTTNVDFAVTDGDGSATGLTITVLSDNWTLIPTNNVTFPVDTGTNRTMHILPATNAFGTGTVSLVVSDADGSVTGELVVTVVSVPDFPTIDLATNTITMPEDTETNIAFTVTNGEGSWTDLVLTVTSTNTTLLPTNNISMLPGTGMNRVVYFYPATNENGTGRFRIKVTDTDGAVTGSVNLTVTPVNDAPGQAGTVPSQVPDVSPTNLFRNLSFFDVDHLKPYAETVTVVAVITAGNSFGSFTTGASYTTNGYPGVVSTGLQNLVFQPGDLSRIETVTVAVVVYDKAGATSQVTYTVGVVGINSNPAPNATVSPASVQAGSSIKPFYININDPDADDMGWPFVVTVGLQNPGDAAYATLGPAPLSYTGLYTACATWIRNIQFTAATPLASNVVVPVVITVHDRNNGGGTGVVSITAQMVNSMPNITGVNPVMQHTTDDPAEPPIFPFSTVTISDPDPQLLTVTLTLSDPALGVLSETNISGTATQVTAAIRAIDFRANQVLGRVLGETVSLNVTIVAKDSMGATRTDSQTLIGITAVNGAPVIGTAPEPPVQPFPLAPPAPVAPFAAMNVFVEDDDSNVTVTVEMDNDQKGALSITNVAVSEAVGFHEQPAGSGAYQFTGTLAQVNLALSNIIYQINEAYPFAPDSPGETAFEITAVDAVLNRASRSLSIILQQERRNLLVTEVMDTVYPDDYAEVGERGRPLKGSLRRVISEANSGDIVTFALPAYPEIIRLNSGLGPIVIARGISLKGPGADLLTISGDSDGNGSADTQLFRVFSWVTMEALNLADGTAGTGGGIYVGVTNPSPGIVQVGSLILRYCAIRHCTARQWGGAIDVDQGQVQVYQCLFEGNTTDETLGLGGGAVSLYTDASCAFVNSTFSANRQQSLDGYGGGAIYAENYEPSTIMTSIVTQCTFADNEDVSDRGSSLSANVFGTKLFVRSTIFADGHDRNLFVQGSGRIISRGGNLSDDSTQVTISQGGVPQSVTLLDAFDDVRSTNPLLQPLNENIHPTPAYALQAGSPAINAGRGRPYAMDQRGVIRDATPDKGAIEYQKTGRVVINEIMPDPAGAGDFIELYVPRDSEPLDLSNYRLFVDRVLRHTFAASMPLIQPGNGILIADGVLVPPNPATPVYAPSVAALNLPLSGSVTLNTPAPESIEVTRADYVWLTIDPFDPANSNKFDNNSLTLCPQYRGAALVPHSLVGAPPFGGADLALASTNINTSSPGADTVATPFGFNNGFPVALDDAYTVTEDWPTSLAVLFNDVDSDGFDQLVVVDVSTLTGEGGDDVQAFSSGGALISVIPSLINPAVSPVIQGDSVEYDPLDAADIQSLTPGAKLTDTFFYDILDVGTGTITNYAAGASVVISSPAHRLTNGTPIAVSGAIIADYNVTGTVTVVDDDTFLLDGIAFSSNTAPRGSWRMLNARVPSARSEGQVTVTVVGENDPPEPADDTVLNITEDSVTRIMGMPDLAGSTTAVFTTDGDYPMVPIIADESLLPNDHDPDSDDEGVSLRIIGVVGTPRAVENYSGTPGGAPVAVTATNHGLVSGDTVLISSYGGHASYNNLHVVTVLDADTFTIPKLFVDNNAVKGLWARMDDDNRLSTTSTLAADVLLEIRADPRETSIIYNPRVSAVLNSVASGDTVWDTFYYVAQDQHGAAALGLVHIPVAGVNDLPVDYYDPQAALDLLAPLAGDTPIGDFLQTIPADYVLPPASGLPDRQDVSVVITSAVPSYNLLLPDFWITDEDVVLDIPQADVLANASDVDTANVLRVSWVSPVSRQGAEVSIAGGGTGNLVYNPIPSARLNALMRGELLFDTFDVAVCDDAVPDSGAVTSLVAVLVRGVNDKPIASNDWYTITEDEELSVGVQTNDLEYDIDTVYPDDRLALHQVPNGLTSIVYDAHYIELPYTITSQLFMFSPTNPLNGLAEGWIATTRFEYVVRDGGLFFAVDDLFTVVTGATDVVLNVLANDRDLNPEHTEFWIEGVGNVNASGRVSVVDGKALQYTPATNYIGDEYFTYVITNRDGFVAKALVRVRVVRDIRNGDIYPMRDCFAAAYGETVSLNLTANDYFIPENGVELEVNRILTAPDQGGTVVIGSGGAVSYTPSAVYGGAYPYHETFSYEVAGGGTARGTSVVDVLVVDRHGTLDVNDDAYHVLAGSLSNRLMVLDNDGVMPFVESTWRIESVWPPTHVAIATNGRSVLYTAAPGFVGRDSFLYVVTDGLGGTGTGVVTVGVSDVEVLPDWYTVKTNSLVELNVLGNDRILSELVPANLAVLDVAPTSTPQGVMGVYPGGSRLTFAASGVPGVATCLYAVADSGGTVVTGQVVVQVLAGNDVVANADVYSVVRDSAANILNVLDNDVVFSSSGGSLVIQAIGTGAGAPNQGGSVTIATNGISLVYTPASGFSGEETFTYTTTDSRDSDIATVVVRVDGGRLRAMADAFTVLYDDDGTGAALTQYTLPVLDNDAMHPNYGQSLSIIAVGLDAAASNAPNQMGGVAISPDGQSLIYTPTNIGFAAEYVEQFTYEITDGTYRRAAAHVSVTVQTRTNAVQLGTRDDAFAVRSNTQSNALPVLSNDGVKPAGTSGWSLTALGILPAHGEAALSGGQLFYTPAPNFVGWDAVGYAVTDGKGGSGNAVAYIWVGEIPHTPDRFVAVSGSLGNAFDVITNDYILGHAIVPLVLGGAGNPSLGGAVSAVGGSVIYTPDAAYAGAYPYTETFEYYLQDQTGGSYTERAVVVVSLVDSDTDTGTVTVVVIGKNDCPLITNDAAVVAITDKESSKPFGPATFIEYDAFTEERVDVSVALDDAAKGRLRNLGGFQETLPGTYVLTNVTAAEATAQLHELVFDPTENRITVPTNEITRFTLGITDNQCGWALDNHSTVDVTAVNDSPEITGTRAGQTMYYLIPINLFSSVTVREVDDLGLQPLSVTVRMESVNMGSLTNLGIFARVTNGVYFATNVNAAQVSDALRTMQYTLSNSNLPVGVSVTNRFTIRVNDGFAPEVEDSITTVIAGHSAVASLQPSNSAYRAYSGAAVDNDCRYAVAGAYGVSLNGTESGSVTIYQRVPDSGNTWIELKSFAPQTADTNDNFGRSVAISGDIVAVGAPGDEATNGVVKGAVYLFQKDAGGINNWGQILRIVPEGLSNSAEFGYDVTLAGDRLAVGARYDRPQGIRSGSVYLFSRNAGGPDAWGQIARVFPQDVAAGTTSLFGRCVALSGDTLAVGAPRNNSYPVTPTEEGAVYVFRRNEGGADNWGFVQKVVSSQTNLSEQFGYDLSLDGNIMAVGAPLMQSDVGGVYIYERAVETNAWMEVGKLNRPTNTVLRFGESLAVDSDLLLVGAPHYVSGDNIGKAFLFRKSIQGDGGWSVVQQLDRPVGSTAGLFGGAVSLYGGYGAVGAPVTLTPVSSIGRLFMYQFRFNNSPAVCEALDDLYALLGQPFSYAIPGVTFADPDMGDVLTLTAVFPSGANGFMFDGDEFSGTPLAVGMTPVELTAADRCGASVSNAFAIYVFDEATMPLTRRQLWNMDNFGEDMGDPGLELTVWGPRANPDGDSSDNDTEYAFGGDPNVMDDADLHLPGVDGVHATVMYFRRTTDPGLTFTLEGSSDMKTWVSVQGFITSEQRLPVSDEAEQVILSVWMPGAAHIRMFRVVVRW